jgi:hypothetical protein
VRCLFAAVSLASLVPFASAAPGLAIETQTETSAVPPPVQPGQVRGAMSRPFVSPAGQVFRRTPESDSRPIQIWLAQVDANRDGVIDLAEFRADFDRAFVSFDLDRDGEIEPAEVTHYETRIFPEIATAGARGGGGVGRGEGGGRRGRGGGGGHGGRGQGGGEARAPGVGGYRMGGAARFGLIAVAHPIMDADENMNRGVTRQEFQVAADRRFSLLDTARNGRLPVSELEARRGPPRGEGGRRRGAASDEAGD